MNKYVPPVCECGEQLVTRCVRVIMYDYPITKKGLVSKKASFKGESWDEGFFLVNKLFCSCGNIYNLELDIKNRIIKGVMSNG